MSLPIEITVNGGGLNPAAGTTTYHNPALENVEFYIGEAGMGTLPYSAYEKIDQAGLPVSNPLHGVINGFRLLDGLQFGADEFYFVYVTGLVYSDLPATDYTNGFHYNKVINSLFGRIGWKQPTQAEQQIIESGNLVSKSGRYFNDGSFHPLVTIQNIKATIEDQGISNSDFNALLQTMQKSSILQCLTAVFNKPELFEQTLLFERCLNNDQVISNTGNFVGVRFKVATGDITAQITSLALYFSQAKTFTLYLYTDTKKAAIWSQVVTTVANDQQVITPETGIFLNNLINSNKSGYYYLGYYQDDLDNSEAIYEQSEEACTKCFGFEFFQSKKTGSDFDRKQISFTNLTFGINAEVSTFRDHTVNIIRNAYLFDEAVGLQMAYSTIKQMIYATRSNLNERIVKEALDKYGIIYELEGAAPIPDVPKSTGLKQRIDQTLKSIKKSFFPDPKAQVVNYADYENRAYGYR